MRPAPKAISSTPRKLASSLTLHPAAVDPTTDDDDAHDGHGYIKRFSRMGVYRVLVVRPVSVSSNYQRILIACAFARADDEWNGDSLV